METRQYAALHAGCRSAGPARALVEFAAGQARADAVTATARSPSAIAPPWPRPCCPSAGEGDRATAIALQKIQQVGHAWRQVRAARGGMGHAANSKQKYETRNKAKKSRECSTTVLVVPIWCSQWFRISSFGFRISLWPPTFPLPKESYSPQCRGDGFLRARLVYVSLRNQGCVIRCTPGGGSAAIHAAKSFKSGTQRASYRLTKNAHLHHEHGRGLSHGSKMDGAGQVARGGRHYCAGGRRACYLRNNAKTPLPLPQPL